MKTTNFGAFVELTKGTDGLLHISNVKPGERVGTVEDVLNSGDEIDVTVVEVDKERGRIGLRLTEDPDVAGKSPEELAGVGTGDPGPPSRRREGGGGRGGDRGGGAAAAAATGRAQRAPLAVERLHRRRAGDRARLRHPGRHRGWFPRCARSRWASGSGQARGTRRPRRPGVSHFLEHLLFKGTKRHSAIEIAEIFDGMGASINAATGKESTHLHARFLDTHTEEAFDLLAEMLLGADLPRDRLRARGRARGDRDVRGRALRPRPRRPRRGDLRRASARPAGARRGRGDQLDPGPRHLRLPPVPLHGRQRRRRGGRQRRPRRDRRARPTLRRTRRPRARARPSSSRPQTESRVGFMQKDTEQYHVCLGGPGIGARRRPPLRARDPRHRLRRLDLVAPLPRGAREARARLRGRLLHAAVRRRRPDRPLRRHPRGQRRGGLRGHRLASSEPAAARASPTTS